MKFLKGVFFFLAAVGAIVTIVLLARNWIEVDRLWAIATSQKSDNMYLNPRNWIMASSLVAFLSGTFLGLAVAWPRSTFNQKLAEKQAKEAVIVDSDPE